MSTFKVGDVVKCIVPNHRLVLFKRYTITCVDGKYVSIDSMQEATLYANRFVKVNSFKGNIK